MAIQVTAGEPLQTFITYVYPDDTPIVGATFSVESALRSDGTSFAGDVIVQEKGNGIYTVTAPTTVTDPPGTWHLVIESDLDDSLFSETFDITNVRPAVTVVQPIYRGGISRRDLRRMVAQELGDLILVTATAQGTESSIVDNINLTLENRHYNGMQIRCTVAADARNVQRTATVTVSSQDSRSVNFIPPFPMPTMPGDEFEFTNFRGTGWRPVEYDNAINAAIRRASDEHFTIPYSETLADAYRRRDEVAIPDGMIYFNGVSYTDRRGNKKRVVPTGYSVDRYARTVELKGDYQSRANGASITIHGEIEAPLLEEDHHQTPIPVEWILTEVKAILQNKAVSQGSGQNRDRLFYMDRQGADQRRSLIIPSRAPNTIKLVGSGYAVTGPTYPYGVFAPEDE
jgi:hypothetical protein